MKHEFTFKNPKIVTNKLIIADDKILIYPLENRWHNQKQCHFYIRLKQFVDRQQQQQAQKQTDSNEMEMIEISSIDKSNTGPYYSPNPEHLLTAIKSIKTVNHHNDEYMYIQFNKTIDSAVIDTFFKLLKEFEDYYPQYLNNTIPCNGERPGYYVRVDGDDALDDKMLSEAEMQEIRREFPTLSCQTSVGLYKTLKFEPAKNPAYTSQHIPTP